MLPKIYNKSQHLIENASIDPHAIEIIARLQSAGYETYLVGGSVRDLLLGHTPKDFDISTDARPEEIKELFRRSCLLIGRRFRLAHIRSGKKVFEVSTFRSGNIETEELIERDNEWGNPEEDVLRRDFTINGLLYNPEKEELIDYVDGFHDIQIQRLRSIGQPVLRFKQDPVRMIRLIKFQARFSLNVDEDLRLALLESRSEILKSSPVRILEEIFRMLESGHARKFIELMAKEGLLYYLFPTLSDIMETPIGNQVYDFLKEIDYMILEFPKLRVTRAICLACITFPVLHAILKEKTKEKLPHLGEIQQQASDLVQEIFHPFFHLPKRIKSDLVMLLTFQYRFTPLEATKYKKRRVSKTPCFLQAMQFFNLRYRLNPTLKREWDAWSRLFQTHKKKK